MKIAVIQSSNDFHPRTNLESLVPLIIRAQELGADLVAFPECALSGFSAKVRGLPTAELQQALIKIQELCCSLQIGIFMPTAIPVEDGWINGAYFFSPKQQFEFHKTGLTDSERMLFQGGLALPRVFTYQGIKIGVLFCREIDDDLLFSEISDSETVLWPGYWGWDDPFVWDDADPLRSQLKRLAKPVIQINFGTHAEYKLPPNRQQGCSVICTSEGNLLLQAHRDVGDILIIDTEELIAKQNGISSLSSVRKIKAGDIPMLKPLPAINTSRKKIKLGFREFFKEMNNGKKSHSSIANTSSCLTTLQLA